ncbi:MAG: transcriptional repressor [Cytophagales bacterium]|nr:transcriptional repressor [Cytophagales bacterium]
MSANNLSYQEIKDSLNAYGIKATQQRIVIYKALVASRQHPSTEIVYEGIKEENPSISLGTVYKTLETFVSKGIAKKVMTDDGYMRYDGMLDSHHHIYCTDTQEILDYDDDELLLLIKDYLEKKNIENLSIQDICVQISGTKIEKGKPINIK